MSRFIVVLDQRKPASESKTLYPEKRDADADRRAVIEHTFGGEELLKHLVQRGPRPPFRAGKRRFSRMKNAGPEGVDCWRQPACGDRTSQLRERKTLLAEHALTGIDHLRIELRTRLLSCVRQRCAYAKSGTVGPVR